VTTTLDRQGRRRPRVRQRRLHLRADTWEGKLVDDATNGLGDFVEIELTVVPAVVIRYALHGGNLTEVKRASGHETIEAICAFVREMLTLWAT